MATDPQREVISELTTANRRCIVFAETIESELDSSVNSNYEQWRPIKETDRMSSMLLVLVILIIKKKNIEE